jgi:hypothetical protein
MNLNHFFDELMIDTINKQLPKIMGWDCLTFFVKILVERNEIELYFICHGHMMMCNYV